MEENCTSRGPQQPARRLQFSLRDIFGLFLVTGVLLTLVVQLKQIGFVASCFLAGVAIGWRLHKWWFTSASLTALLVYVVTYAACWIEMGYAPRMHRWPASSVRYELDQINEALIKYCGAKGAFPDSLQQLSQLEDHDLWFGKSGELLDGWRHPFHYRRIAEGFELASLGREGKPGGVGLDADVFFGDEWFSPKTRLPLKQFLFETEGSASVFLVAFVASILAASIWFGARHEVQPSIKWVIIGVATMAVLAVVVAAFLAAIHVDASQSGH